MILFFLLFLPSPARSQEAAKILYQSDFTGGLNTRQASIHIADNECSDVQNFYFDEKGLQKRGGSQKRNVTALGDGGNDDVNGFFEYKKSDGTDYCVAFSSKTGYYSTDRCATFTAFISTLTVESDVNCVPFTDRLYCANGTEPGFYFDGSNDIDAGNMPACKGLRTHQNRLWCYGVAGNLSRVYYSNISDGNTWNTTLQYLDFNPEDGDVVSGIGLPIFEILPVYKKYSTWIIQGAKSDNYTPIPVNATIGAKSHRAITNLLVQGKNIQVFDSLGPLGSEPGIYFFNGIVVNYASARIRDNLRNLPNFTSLAAYKQWNTKSEFDTGTFNLTSSSIEPGMISPSSWTHTDTSAADWVAGTLVNISTNVISGQLELIGASQNSVLYDNFSDGDYTNNPVWTPMTPANTCWSVVSGILGCTGTNNQYRISSILPQALDVKDYFSFSAKVNAGHVNGSFHIHLGTTAANVPNTYLYLVSLLGGGADDVRLTYGSSFCEINYNMDANDHTITITKNFNTHTLTFDSQTCSFSTNSFSALITTITVTGNPVVVGAITYSFGAIDDVYISTAQTSGTFTSAIFDTTFSTPIGGPFSFSKTVPVGSTIAYSVRNSSFNSTDGMGSWSLVSTTTSGAYRTPLTKRYWQYKADFSTDYSTQTPSIADITMSAASTGTWTSPEVQLNEPLSATWNLFQAQESAAGSCVWTYQLKSSTYSGGTANASWTTQTNNSVITITTGAYIAARVTNNFFTSTDTCQVDSLTVNYTIGAEAHSSAAGVYKGRYYWFGQSQGGTYNDLAYVLDSNNVWTRLAGINARSAAIIDGELYTGDSLLSSSGFIRRQNFGTTDDGVAIIAYWRGKDFLLTSDELKKTVLDVYITYISSANTSMSASLYGDGALFDSYTINLTSAAPFGVQRWHPITSDGGLRAQYHSIRFDHNASNTGGSILGYRLYWQPSGIAEP